MKTILTLCLLLTYSLFGIEKPFVIVIPSYNNARYFEKNLDSVLSQNYNNFRVIYIDDASTDFTGSLVEAYLEKHDTHHRVTLIKNTKRTKALANKYKGIWLCNPEEIIVGVDGDDWLFDENVLSYLNEIYQDPNVWLTYGQFVYSPSGNSGWASEVKKEIIEQNAFRQHNWQTTHLHSFYAALFHKIKKEDLYYGDDFFEMAEDLARMFPMLEMAGFHSKFIPKVLYVYNFGTPLNDGVLNGDLQMRLGWEVRKKPKYQPLKSLF